MFEAADFTNVNCSNIMYISGDISGVHIVSRNGHQKRVINYKLLLLLLDGRVHFLLWPLVRVCPGPGIWVSFDDDDKSPFLQNILKG